MGVNGGRHGDGVRREESWMVPEAALSVPVSLTMHVPLKARLSTLFK